MGADISNDLLSFITQAICSLRIVFEIGHIQQYRPQTAL